MPSAPLAVRAATPADLPCLDALYRSARAFMAASGNPTQWGTDRPTRAQLEGDIARGQLWLVCRDGVPHGAFALVPGQDPTYRVIDGAWQSDAPYLTIHRLAGDGICHGIFAAAVAFAAGRCPHLRIDTHADNRPMRNHIAGAGFVYCGIIRVEDGSPRLAYERLS